MNPMTARDANAHSPKPQETIPRSRDLDPLSATEAKAARLEFLRVMLSELKQMADGIDERTLSYLVGMAALEAAESAKVHKYRTELHGK
jgi:hypothetical protein